MVVFKERYPHLHIGIDCSNWIHMADLIIVSIPTDASAEMAMYASSTLAGTELRKTQAPSSVNETK